MSHVDEGQLHAYLDGALGSDELRSRVEDHLRLCADCRSRLDAARRDRDEAGQILALLDPGEVRVPPMEELRGEGQGADQGADQGAARGLTWGERASGAGSRRSGPAIPLRLAWAASVLLALGGGWMLRSAAMPGEEGATSRVATAVSMTETRGAAAADHAADQGADRAADPAVALAAPAPPVPAPDQAPVAESRTVAGLAPVPDLARNLAADRASEPARAPTMDAATGDLDLALAESTAWVDISPAAAAALLGQPPLELEGIPWERFEVLQAEDHVLIRSFHPLDDGVRIELLQGRRQGEAEALGAWSAETRLGQTQTRADPTGPVPARPAQARGAQARAAQAPPAQAPPAQELMRALAEANVPFPPAGSAPEGHALVRSEREGISYLLRGPVEREVLEGLLQRVR